MIILDGKHISEFGYKAQVAEEQELTATPPIRRKTITIPGMPGAWDFGSELESKPLNIALLELSEDEFGLQRKQNKLVRFLMDDFGRPRLIKIVYTFEPDKYIMAKIDDAIAPTLMAHVLRYKTLPFIAHDPYKYSRVLSDEVTWGSEIVTFEWDYLLGHEGTSGGVTVNGPTTFNIAVEGLAVQPAFEIEGTANNVKVECGKYSFMLPNFTNAKWEVDFMKYIAYKNGLENMIDMDEFFLLPGNNEIKVTGSNINIEMRIKFRDKFN